MPRQAAVVLTVMQKLRCGHRAVEDAQQILGRDPVAGLIVEDRHDGCTVRDEATDNHDFRNRVIGAAGMARQTFGAGERGKEDDGITAELNIVPERRLPRVAEMRLGRIECERFERGQIDGENFSVHEQTLRSRRPSNHCQESSDGRPHSTSRTRFAMETASANSPLIPRALPNNTNVASCTPRPAGTTKAKWR